MEIEKQVTFIENISQREEQNANVCSVDLTLNKLYECCPDLKTGQINTLFEDERINHIFICVYENFKGEGKRRIGGMHKKTESNEELMDIVKKVTESLGIKITRSLELLQNPNEV